MKKRIVSLLLVLAMVLSLVPFSAFAAGRDETKAQVHVTVENNTFSVKDGAPWAGTLVDTWVEIDESSTMISCVDAALEEAGLIAEGLDSGYISSVNGLAAYDGGAMSGWMGTLNDWFTNYGFDHYTVAAGTLEAGDEIAILYSCDYGADLGSDWSSNDTSLKALSFSKGTLSPAFASETLEYTLALPAGTDSIVVTPTAANKNFQVHIKVGQTEYKRTATVPVADGTVLTLEVGTGESMNSGATPTTYTVTVKLPAPVDPSVSADWPSFRGNSQNNGVTSAATPRSAEETELKWAVKHSTGWTDAPSPLLIVDDSLVVLYGNSIKKLSLETGEVLASAQMCASTSWGSVPVTYTDGIIFCPLGGGTVQAFNAETLEPLWSYTDALGGQAQSPITCADGKIYVGFGYNREYAFVCLDAANGSLVWRQTDEKGYYWAGAVVAGDYVICGSDSGHIYSRNKDTGALISDLTVGSGSIRSTVCYEDGKIYFTLNNASLCRAALDLTTGVLSDLTMKDCSAYGSSSVSTPVVYDGIVYIGVGGWSGSKNVIAVDADTMEVLWSVEEPAYPQCSILLSTAYEASGYVYLYVTCNANPGGINVIKAKTDGSEAVQTTLYDAAGYEQFCICSVIAGSDGTLYYKNDSSNVFALGMTQAAKDQLAADDVVGLIDAIGTVTLESETAIDAARTAYDALTDAQKALVTNYDVLTAAEARLAALKGDKSAADAVIELIDAIGTVTLSSGPVIESARAAYDALTDAQKALVTNYDVLTAAEARLEALKDENTAVPVEVYVTISNAGSVVMAQKKIVVTDKNDNGFFDVDDALWAAHEADYPGGAAEGYGSAMGSYGLYITQLWGDTSGAFGYWLNNASCWSLTDVVKDGDHLVAFVYQDSVYYSDAFTKFDSFTYATVADTALTVALEQAGYDDNWNTVFAALTGAQILAFDAEMKTVGSTGYMFTDLGNGSYSVRFAEAGSYYLIAASSDTLIVPAVCEVTVGVNADKDAADAVTALIDAIGTVTLESETAISAARTAYDALTDAQKALVTNYDVLTAAETKLAALKADRSAAASVTALIDAIGTVTLESETAINAARTAYDALTDAQKALVTNYDVLTAAEAKLAALKADKSTAASVAALIDAIGTVTLESETAISTARAAYDALTDAQKALVTNYDVLTEAEALLVILKLPRADVEKVYWATGDYLEALAAEHTPTVGSVGGDWIVLGLARSGRNVPDAYYGNVITYVSQNINDKEQLHRSKSTDNSRVILALTALGKDVTDVDGHDLLQGLTDMTYLTKQGINGPVWALIAFDCGKYEIPAAAEGAEQVTREKLVAYILSAQLKDGGWALSGDIGDPDMTAMALQALAPYYSENKAVKAAVDAALVLLSETQQEDGGYGSWNTVNAESSAQVIVALTALGIDPNTDARFVKNGRSVVDALCDYYVEGGGFRHLPGGDRDGMATEQGYYALAAYHRLLNGQSSLYDMSDVTIQVPEVPFVNPYTDVTESDWFYEAVKYTCENGLMNGMGKNTFAPETEMTRAMLVTVLYRAEGSPDVSDLENPYKDVDESWYTDAVCWAAANQIVNGVSDGVFAPDDSVTREQMVTILYRYANYKGKVSEARADLDSFPDADQLRSYAKEAMSWAVAEEIIQGSAEGGKTYILPANSATRAEIATVLMRYVEKFGE